MSARNDSLTAARESLAQHLPRWWRSPSQAGRILALADRAVLFAERTNCTDLGSFGPSTARAFVDSASADGAAPSVDLRHRRKLALRLLYRAAREDGLTSLDPTVDLALPPRSQLHTRPLTDEEMTLCRASAAWSLSDSRRATALAMAEATGRTVELAHARVEDLDLDARRIWLRGGASTSGRWGVLSEWGAAQIRRHLSKVDDRLLYTGGNPATAGQISVSIALGDVLTRAGLRGEPDVRPASIVGWAGRQILEDTGRIDEVARRLGVSSLDRAAHIIGWDWAEADRR